MCLSVNPKCVKEYRLFQVKDFFFCEMYNYVFLSIFFY